MCVCRRIKCTALQHIATVDIYTHTNSIFELLVVHCIHYIIIICVYAPPVEYCILINIIILYKCKIYAANSEIDLKFRYFNSFRRRRRRSTKSLKVYERHNAAVIYITPEYIYNIPSNRPYGSYDSLELLVSRYLLRRAHELLPTVLYEYHFLENIAKIVSGELPLYALFINTLHMVRQCAIHRCLQCLGL